jgi:hypothetical protein
MFMALIGSIVAQLTLAGLHDSQLAALPAGKSTASAALLAAE